MQPLDDADVFESRLFYCSDILALDRCSTNAISPKLGNQTTDLLYVALYDDIADLDLPSRFKDSVNLMESLPLLRDQIENPIARHHVHAGVVQGDSGGVSL